MNRSVLHKAINALFSRGIGLLLQLSLTVILGRMLGAAGMGVFSLYTSWMMMFASISDLGMPNHVLRTVSVEDDRKKRNQAIRFTLSVIKTLLLSGVLLAFLMMLISDLVSPNNSSIDYQTILTLSALSAVAFTIIRVLSEALKGIRQVNLALTAETALLPLAVLTVLGILHLYDWDISAQGYLVLHLILMIVVTMVMLWMLLHFKAQSLKTDEEEVPALFNRSLLPFWGSGLLNMWFMNMPIILLPQFATTEEIGVFGVAYRLIAFASIILVTLASLFAPKFARDFANSDVEALKQGLKHSQKLSMLIFIPMLIVFTVFAEPMLGMFGEEFKAGKEILWILVVGQTINAATGLVGFMMNMIHQEKQEFYIHLTTTLTLMAMIFLLGNPYGVTGVAVAYAAALVIKNLTSLIFSLYHLNAMQRLAGAM
ncbi:MAG: oligosaccharide flippase family protein [Gammaproteobacteria bacterium]|nr:oligosaccharide flippase family protein [Gammaproteobacteria bacterium]